MTPHAAPLSWLCAVWSVLLAGVMLLLDRRQRRAIERNRGVVPQAFQRTVSAGEHDRAVRYGLARLRAAMLQRLTELAAALFALFAGFDLAARLAGAALTAGIGRSLLLVGLLWAAQTAIVLPASAWRTLSLEQRFGFNRTSPARFARDAALRALLSVAIGGPLLALLLLAERHLPGRWWLAVWLAVWLVLVAMMLAGPTISLRLLAPLFNRVTPLREPVAGPVAALLRRTGFRAGALLEVDASRRSSRGNAFVSGLGPAKRIVLFDTLIEAHPQEEIEAVVAHELGHLHHRHILAGTLRGAVLLFGLCLAVGWLSRQPWLQRGFAIAHPDPALGLVLALLLVGIASPVLSVLGNLVSRRHEYQADAFARRMVGAAPMIAALVRLSRDNAATLVPDRLYSLVHHTHPPVPLRVARLAREAA